MKLFNVSKEEKVKRNKIFLVVLVIGIILTLISIFYSKSKDVNIFPLQNIKSMVGKEYEGFDLSLVMYDSQIDDGKTQLTEDTWHATENQTRIITVQVNLKNENVSRTYNPGELSIKVDNLGVVCSEQTVNSEPIYKNAIVSADSIYQKDKKYEWSYEYNEETRQYTLTNNDTIEENSNFEGTIQLSYDFEASYLLNDSNIKINAILNDTIESNNILNFNFTSTEKETRITNKSGNKINSYDGLGENAEKYIWVKYNISVSNYEEKNVRGVIYDQYIFESVNNDCIILDKDLNVISEDENGKYKIPIDLISQNSEKGSYSDTNSICRYFIGYPLEIYDGQKIETTTELYGKVKDSYILKGKEKEEKLLAQKTITLNLDEFKFSYTGDLYSIEEGNNWGHSKKSYNKISKSQYGEDTGYYIGCNCRYTGKKFTARIGNDLLFITNEEGNYRKLTENEYYYKQVEIDSKYFYNGNNNILEYDKYNINLFVRYKGTEEYIQYGDTFKNSNEKITINFVKNEQVVAWYIEIYDLEESLKISHSEPSIYGLKTHIYFQVNEKLAEEGNICNLSYLQIFTKDENGQDKLENEVTLENYDSNLSKINIASYDLETYGKYIQRTYKETYYGAEYIKFDFRNLIYNKNQDNDYFYKELSVWTIFDGINGTASINKFNGYKLYNLFPEGIEINGTEDDIIKNIKYYNYSNFNYNEILRQDGTGFTKEEYIQFIKEHTKVNIDKNYKNTGRLWVEIIVDYSDSPLNTYGLEYKQIYPEDFYIPIKIPYESYFSHGRSYTITSYIALLNDVEEYIPYNKIMDESDVDNDGDVTDFYVARNSSTTNIVPAVSSYQEVNTSVWSENTENQWINDVASVKYNGQYKYKLRVRTGANSIKNLVIYDNLEEESSWNGIFQGVDLEFTNSQGYTPKVYYSTERSPGNLDEHPEAWQIYTEEVDKRTVKSIAIDYEDQVIPSGSLTYAIINMKAPENVPTTDMAFNNCYTTWTAIDDQGNEIDNVSGIKSNIALVAVPNSLDKLTVNKVWEDNENNLGVRPENVNISILKNSELQDTATLNNGNEWKHIFDIPICDENGNKYNYTVQEQNVNLYNSTIENTDIEKENGTIEKNFTITNALQEDKVYMDISGTKNWDDSENAKNVRPKEIEINLFKNGELFSTTKTNQSKNWKYEFSSVPMWKNNAEKNTYEVREVENKFYSNETTQILNNGLKIKFSENCITENKNYDYVEIYYSLNGRIYKTQKYGGMELKNAEIIIPSKDFYLYWKTNASNSNYYGFKIDSIKQVGTKETPLISGMLPSYEVEEVSGNMYPESEHIYTDNLNKLWHYTATEDTAIAPAEEQPENYKVYDITNTYKAIPSNVVVHHYIQGTENKLSEDVIINGNVFDNYTTSPATDIPEYYELVEMPENASGEFTEDQIEVTYYYKYKKYNYNVEYYYDGVIDNSKKETIEATYQDQITTYTDKNITGYKLEKTENLPLTISENTDNNVIKIYYVKDKFNYTVEYYYDGEINNDNTETIEATYQDEITTYADKNITGYKLEKTENLPLTISENYDNNVVKVYYVKDNFNYTIEYYYDGEINNDNTETIEATYQDEITTYADKNITGYKLEKTENLPLTISENSDNNVVKVYYVKDNFNYTIEYYYDGILNEDNIETIEAIYQDEITTYTDKNITGYKLEKTENLPLTISENSDNNVIKVYYIIDDGNTKELSYTVEYYKDNVKVDEDTQTESKTVQTLQPDTLSVDKSLINTTDKYAGYKFDKTEPETIPDTVNNGDVIKVYYVRDNFNYRVEYYYDGEIDNSKTEITEAGLNTVIDTYQDKNITGYKLEKVENLPLTVSTNPEENVIKVYYVKDKFNYTIEYYYNGNIDNEKTETMEATYQDIITTYPDKRIEGFALDKTENLPLTVSELPATNVIKVYYVTGRYTYTVEYYYDDVKDKDKTETYEAEFGEKITSFVDKPIYGYKYERVYNMPLTISEDPYLNIIIVYYVRKDAQITVKYVDKETEEEISDDVVVTGKVFDEHDTAQNKKELEGYTLIEEPDPRVVTFTEKEQTVVFYYSKNTEVIVKYLEKDDTPEDNTDNLVLSEDIIIKGIEGEEYTTEQKEIEGYTFVESTENTSGKMTREPITVIYYYLQNTRVIVNHIDKNTEEKLEVVTQEGKVGDVYTASAKDFEGYVLVEKPEEETVVMTKEEIVLNYYYVHISAGVIEKHINFKTDELLYSQLHEGNEGDQYSTSSKEFEGFDIITNEMYYTAHPEILEENEVSTVEELLEKLELKADEPYIPENYEGIMTIEPIEIKYYYIRKTSVTVEYIDKITGEKIPELIEDTENTDSENTQYKEVDSTEYFYGYEGDPYKTEEKKFEGYDLVEVPENAEGTMEVTVDEEGNVVTETKVTYYYAHTAEVIEKHINVKTNMLLEDEVVHLGHEGDKYSIKSKEFEGYDIVTNEMYYSVHPEILEENEVSTVEELLEKLELKADEPYIPENYEGTMTIEPITVEYYYIRKAQVKVEYIDKVSGEKILELVQNTEDIDKENPDNEDSNIEDPDKEPQYKKVDSTEYIYGHEGDAYKTEEKEFEGYDLIEVPENKEGIMEITEDEDGNVISETVVRYYYAKPAKVIEKHIDAITGKLLERETVYEGHEGDSYKTSSKEFKDFELVKEKLPKNSEGTMTVKTIEVEYYYIRKVRVVVEHLEIGTEKKLADDEIIDGHEGDRYYTNSKNINGFKLLTNKMPANKDGVMEKNDIVVKYYYEHKGVTEQKPPAPTNSSQPSTPSSNTKPTPKDNTMKFEDRTNKGETPKKNNIITPNTGDILPVVAIGTISIVGLANIVVSIARKKKHKKQIK